jgi:hypothetical protein
MLEGMHLGKQSLMKSDYVKIASYMFLDKYRKEREGDAPGVIYNKFITLLHSDLKLRKIDIKLPHCWYRWGDIVVGYCVPYVHWNHDQPNYTTVKWIGDEVPAYESNDEVISLIKKNMTEFMLRHKGSDAHETAKDEVYDGAPFDFQKDYKKLRESLDSMSKRTVMNNSSEYLAGLFYPTMENFPKNEFKNILNEKEKFEAVFKMGLESNVSPKDLYDLTEYFWYFFCYHLRLHKKCNENIPANTLAIWKEEIPWETQKMEQILQNFAEKLTLGNSNNHLVISLLEDREKRIERLDVLTSKLCDDET